MNEITNARVFLHHQRLNTKPQQHPFNGHLTGISRVSRYQKGKTNMAVASAGPYANLHFAQTMFIRTVVLNIQSTKCFRLTLHHAMYSNTVSAIWRGLWLSRTSRPNRSWFHNRTDISWHDGKGPAMHGHAALNHYLHTRYLFSGTYLWNNDAGFHTFLCAMLLFTCFTTNVQATETRRVSRVKY